MSSIRALVRFLISSPLVLLFCFAALGQITSITDQTSTPIPGAGHDYLHLLDETVNPANGSVSLRIQVPVPKGRGLDIPFAFAYDSNGGYHLSPTAPIGYFGWFSNTNTLGQGGWSYAVPQVSSVNSGFTVFVYPNTYINCIQYSNYMFEDPNGGQHALGLGTQYSGGTQGDCPQSSLSVQSSGDPQVKASLPTTHPDPTYNPTATDAAPVTVYTADGTVYTFPSAYGLPSKIEDRNGNIIAVTGSKGTFAFTDTLGRQVISGNGFGPSGTTNTITVGGLAYQVTWTTVASSFSVSPYTQVGTGSGGNCYGIPGASLSQVVISKITLPNGKFYQFTYNTTYGLLSEITYPDGGWVQYTWKLSDNANSLADGPSAIPNGQGGWNPVIDGCLYQYKTPVVATRTVGTGSSTQLTQSFTYSTTWNSSGNQWTAKSTNVTTTDNVRNISSVTAYSYSSITAPPVPFAAEESSETPVQIPVEAAINYCDWGSASCSAGWLKQVNKAWYDQYNLASEQTLLLTTGATALTSYCYVGTSCAPSPILSQLQSKAEYDFGGALLRTTTNTYQSFSSVNSTNPSYINYITDAVCSTKITDGGGNRIAETDYYYDGATSLCAAITSGAALQGVTNISPVTHDGTNFGPSSTLPRGNVTKVSKLCFVGSTGCSTGNATTTFAYDVTGQVSTKTDPCGNASCSDIASTSHTTTYSFTDNFDSPPAYNTNAYLTKITNPLGQNVSFKYAYSDGQLIQSTDLNSLVTSYTYADSLRRLTEAAYPNGGTTINSYNDVAPTPSITTTKTINSTQTLSTTAIRDGLGHVTHTQLTSDPQGTIYTDTTYDGVGDAYAVSNPYRSCASDITSSCGTTTYYFDALKRKKTVTYPDGSILSTTYCGPSTLVTDPTNRWRRSRADGLGRLVEVDEPNAVGATVSACPAGGDPIWVTSYGYSALDTLTGVVQNGSHSRSFVYDSLSRLTASTNPEVGTINYVYDANSNVQTKTDARAIVTTYGYDPLNRELSRSYSNSDPTVTEAYDQSACLTLSACQNIGYRTSMTDAAGSESWAYDVISGTGSVHADQRIISGNTKTTTYSMDLAGNVSQIVYPTGRIVNYTYDAANRPITAADGSAGTTYATGFLTAPGGSCIASTTCYTPQGSIYAMSLGQSASFTGLNITDAYNNRLQPQEFKASSPGGNAIDISYSYIDPTSQKNAGHVNSITNNLDTTRSQTFTYDQLNRITASQTASTHTTSTAHCWAETYNLDAWGNLQSIAQTTNSNYTGCSQESGFSTTASTNNHIGAFSYDSSGNALSDGNYSYTWNGESQLKSAAGVNYLYDGDGRRVAKVGSKLYWYGVGGEILAETDASGNSTAEYIYFDGKRIARIADSALPVQNASFEAYNPLTAGTCGTNCAWNNGPIPGWNGTGVGSAEYNSSYYDLPLPNGNIVAWSNGNPISQTLSTPVQANTTYTLSVYLGHLLTGYVTTYTISLEAGSTVLATKSGSTGDIALGEFAQQTLTYTSGASVPSGNLTIVLSCAAAQCDFDAVQLSAGLIEYYVSDSLDSSRIITSASGAVLDDSDFYPYGGERPYSSSSGNVYKFEGKERDAETGNDDFGARYYTWRFGRWLSADWSNVPVAVPYANLSNPQTLNLYSMVADDPETFADLDGHINCDGSNTNGAGCQYIRNWNEEHGLNQQTAQNQVPTLKGVAADCRGCTSEKKAAIAAEKAAVGQTRADGKKGKYQEYGGWVITKDGKTFTYTKPVTFGKDAHFYPSHVTVPDGYAEVASFHTHPDPGSWGEGFSEVDMAWARRNAMNDYVGMSYSGNVRVFVPGQTKDNGLNGVSGDLIYTIP